MSDIKSVKAVDIYRSRERHQQRNALSSTLHHETPRYIAASWYCIRTKGEAGVMHNQSTVIIALLLS